MDIAEFDKMFEVEETNWWYRGRRQLVTEWIERKHGAGGSLRMLDIACATGSGFRFFKRFGDIRGIDISEETIRLCKRRGVNEIVRGDAMRLPFRDGSFDLLLALDAIEHFEDDRAAIAEMRRVVRPGGLVLLTTPAFMFLWSHHDDAYHHFRRYTRSDLGDKLRQGGLEPEKLSYYSMTLLPPVYLMRKLRSIFAGKGTPRSDFFVTLPAPIEMLLSGIMKAEIAALRRVNLPFGVSLFCAATRGED